MAAADAIDTVRRWARDDVDLCPAFDPATFPEQFEFLNSKYINHYIVDIDRGVARLRPKANGHPLARLRADVFFHHIEQALRSYPLDVTTSLALAIQDLVPESSTCPLFSFQRRKGSRNLLLPDLDALLSKYYADTSWGLPDDIPFREKSDRAVFAGSTTGVEPIEDRHLMHPFPRLRAARFFRGNPRVDFRLASIVQTRDAAIDARLRAEGFGANRLSWREQMRCKLLLSMDGNGATLSRLYVALASNCALVKYASEYEAFYFRALVPGLHYILIEKDEDVLSLVDSDLNRYEPVAYAGKVFVERYLTPALYEAFTATLIQDYAARFPLPSRS